MLFKSIEENAAKVIKYIYICNYLMILIITHLKMIIAHY